MNTEKKEAIQNLINFVDEYITDLKRSGKATTANLIFQSVQNSIRVINQEEIKKPEEKN